jgi:hypothetical protein
MGTSQAEHMHLMEAPLCKNGIRPADGRAIGAASQHGAARDDSREGSARDRPGNAPASILDRDDFVPSMGASAADEEAFRAHFQREGDVSGTTVRAGRGHT